MQLDALEEAGLLGAQVEHACTIAWGILNRSPEQIKAVVEYIKKQGAENIGNVLFNHPKLLEYDPEGDELVKPPRARAKLNVSNRDGHRSVLVSWYSKNAAFDTAPIAPWSP